MPRQASQSCWRTKPAFYPAAPHSVGYPSISHLSGRLRYHTDFAVSWSVYSGPLVDNDPNAQKSVAGSLDMPKRRHQVLLLNERESSPNFIIVDTRSLPKVHQKKKMHVIFKNCMYFRKNCTNVSLSFNSIFFQEYFEVPSIWRNILKIQ